MRIFMYFLFISVLSGCQTDEFDGVGAARGYCDCLQKEHDTGKDFFDARTKCDAELLAKNRYFRIIYNENTYGSYMHFLPKQLDDSAVNFINDFNKYLDSNCRKFAFMGCDSNDILQKKRKVYDLRNR